MEEGGGLRNESWSTSTLRSVKGDQEGVASEIGFFGEETALTFIIRQMCET